MVTGSIYTLKILCLFRIYVYIVTAPLMLFCVRILFGVDCLSGSNCCSNKVFI